MKIRTLLESLDVAFSMYSAIPMPQIEWNERNMKYMMAFFPMVGVVQGALLLGLCAAAVYQVTGCLVMTSVFHMGFLVAQTLLLHGPNPQQVLSAAVMVLLLAAALVGCWAALALSPNGKETIQKMVVQQKNPIRHPYVFRTSFNFFAVVLVLFATTVLWYPLLLGNEAT